MVKLKGLYEWELRDASTQQIVKKGEQWNVVSDFALTLMCTNSSPSNFSFSIQLSDSTPNPSADYRTARMSNSFNILVQSGAIAVTSSAVLKNCYVGYNFVPPVAPRTVNVIGIGSTDNFYSFIELSVPITQQTNQYLYVKYTMYFSYSSGGVNVPDNRYVEWGMNNGIVGGTALMFGHATYFKWNITQFVPPSDIDKVMRRTGNTGTGSIYSGSDFVSPNSGSQYSRKISKSFAVGDVVGPIGAITFSNALELNSSSGWWDWVTYGYSPMSALAPSISRVFVHPSANINQIFSDPANPASSNGTIVPSGTPTNKWAIIARVKITRTGDASDIVDETFLPAAVNVGTNEITITQSFAMNDIVRFTNSGGALPTGISVGIDYYVIQAGTTVKLSTSFGGLSITISDQGTGIHTIYRMNTAKFQIELEPWINGIRSGRSYTSSRILQISMGIDIDNNIMPHNVYSLYDTGEGGTANVGSMVRGVARIGNYLYTVQRSAVTNLMQMCKWLFNSIETSEALCKFGNASTDIVRVENDGTYMYIASNDGIYKYDTSTPAVAPVLLSITGMIGTAITDMVYDSITGYLWTGHATGLSKIDVGALTATQYLSGTGKQLDGMLTDDVNIVAGELEAYNSRIFRAGRNSKSMWVMDDGVGWYKWGTCSRGAIRKGTSQVVGSGRSWVTLYNVMVTGKGTGSNTVTETYAFSNNNASTYGPMVSLNKDAFMFQHSVQYYSGARTALAVYRVGQGVWTDPTDVDPAYAGFLYATPWEYSLSKNVVAVNDSGLCIGQALGDGVLTPIEYQGALRATYGWNGANWVLDNSGEKYMPKTATETILDGIILSFNNATGKTWDQQFVLGERFTFVYAPVKIKDNLQTMQAQARFYYGDAQVHENKAITIPASVPYEFNIEEKSNPDFRDMDILDYLTDVYEGVTQYTLYTLPVGVAITGWDLPNDKVTIAQDIATGTAIVLTTTGNFPSYAPFSSHSIQMKGEAIFYAIRDDSTHIKFAASYADALATTAIDLSAANTSGTVRVVVVEPTTGTYYASVNGVFVFATADATKNLTLTYTYTLFS